MARVALEILALLESLLLQLSRSLSVERSYSQGCQNGERAENGVTLCQPRTGRDRAIVLRILSASTGRYDSRGDRRAGGNENPRYRAEFHFGMRGAK